jgi:hypothetical protein
VKLNASRWLIAVVAAFPLLCAYSCAVPLGPGYHIEKESVELSFSAQPKPRLHLDARFSLQNVGNAPLSSLDVSVPEKGILDRENLRITIDGKDARITDPPDDEPSMIVQIPFERAWTPHQKMDIEIACDMPSGFNDHTVMAQNAFAFDGAYWFPTFQAPKRLFAKGEQRADLTDLSIVVPKDFLAVASGLQTGRKTSGNTVKYRYRVLAKDGNPFVVAGRYKQQIAKSKGSLVYFWTFQGLPEDAVASAGGQIAAAAQFFDSSFVPRARGKSPVWVVEIPENQIFSLEDSIATTTAAFPNTILLGKDALSKNIGRGQISPAEIGLLSDTWLQWMASANGNEPMLQIGLQPYMVDAFQESREGAAYHQMKIVKYLRQYDLAYSPSVEKPLAQITSPSSNDANQLDMALAKAFLFPYALEDACGQAAFRRGIGVMLSDLRGSQYGYQDLRAALKGECGANANIDMLFRAWLYEKGIPVAFRERYASATPQETR